jgi:hypothetical protein
LVTFLPAEIVRWNIVNFSTGAGAVNFGLGNAWDHASRLEKMDVVFVGVSDPFVAQVSVEAAGALANDLTDAL